MNGGGQPKPSAHHVVVVDRARPRTRRAARGRGLAYLAGTGLDTRGATSEGFQGN